MAYMNQEKKAVIAAALKAVVPAGWKYSLAVRHHSTIVLTVRSAPIDLVQMYGTSVGNLYAIRSHCRDAELADILCRIVGALNSGNYDNSDIMTDYFDVGHYVDFRIGQWDKPFVVTA